MKPHRPSLPPRLPALLVLLAVGAACDVDVAAPRPPELVLLVNGSEPAAGAEIDLGELTIDPGAATPVALRLAVSVENRGARAADFSALAPLRLLADPALAFRTSQPRVSSLAGGQRADGLVLFAPTAPGAYSAELTLITDPPLASPPVVRLRARASAQAVSGTVGLGLEDGDGAPVEAVAFGAAELGAPVTRLLSVVNTGNVPVAAGALRISVLPDGDVFSAGFPESFDVIAPGAAVQLALEARSATCGDHAARLEVGTAANGVLASATLAFTAGPTAARVPAIVSPERVLRSGRVPVAQSGIRAWRVAVGDASDAAGLGSVHLVDFETCAASPARTVGNPSEDPSWGHRAALGGDGSLLLATWPEVPYARLVGVAAASEPLDVLLRTSRSGAGFGASVALSSGGELALVGRPGAPDDAASPGGVWLFQRPNREWAGLAAETLRLSPSLPEQASGVGRDVLATQGADMVLATGRFAAEAGRLEAGVWVWRARIDPSFAQSADGRVWGRAAGGDDPRDRVEHQLLQAGEVFAGGEMLLGASRAGGLVALAHGAGSAVLRLHLFVQSGGDFGSGGERALPDRSRDLPGGVAMAVDPDGARLYVAKATGGLVALTPAGGDWRGGVIAESDLTSLRPAGAVGALRQLGVSPDGHVLAGLTDGGDLEILRLLLPAP